MARNPFLVIYIVSIKLCYGKYNWNNILMGERLACEENNTTTSNNNARGKSGNLRLNKAGGPISLKE